VKQLVIKSQNKKWAKTFMDSTHYDQLIDEDVFIRNEKGDPVLVLIKGAIALEKAGLAWMSLQKINAKTSNRSTATGITAVNNKKLDGTLAGTSEVPIGWEVNSSIVGYFERTVRMPYARPASWNRDDPVAFARLFPALQQASEYFRKLVPDRYKIQNKYVEKTNPAWVIPGTVFTTLTINKNFRTACHLDAGDLESGFSNMWVIKQGAVKGGHLVLPNYRVAVKLDNLDLVLFDAHEWHGNTSIILGSKDAVRCSVVCYYRTKMVDCGSPKEELRRAKNRKPGQSLYE
jgi:Oxygenase domain of the 2OGFeDO superfamily